MPSRPQQFLIDGHGGVRIAADRHGDPAARAVVFLHGGGQTRRSWGRAAATVARRGWQAVTVDMRGHGESDWSPDGDYRVSSFAADVREILDQLPPRPVLVGASLGGLTEFLGASLAMYGGVSPSRPSPGARPVVRVAELAGRCIAW